MKKRVLIIGYFYPDPNMGGVRLRRIARQLPQHGWEPVVLTHPRDATSVSDMPPEIRIEEAAGPDLTLAYRRIRRTFSRDAGDTPAGQAGPKSQDIGFTTTINRWLMIPDKQITWYRAAVRRGRELLRREKFDAIFASIEPRTSGLVAARLARDTGVRCIVEYRDLWTGNPYHHVAQATALHRFLHARLERKMLRHVDGVSAVCRGIGDYLTREYAPLLRAPVRYHYNFFVPSEYPRELAAPVEARPFTISYTGAMFTNRAPHQFFEGMQRFLRESGLKPNQFRFKWAGGAAGIDNLGELLDRTGVRPYLDYLGQIPHRDALRLLLGSDAALLIHAPGDTIHIPGKLSETMGARVPLLALAHPCEVTEIIERCQAGIICPHTAESVAKALAEFHQRFQTRRPWAFNDAEILPFSADETISRLAAMLDSAEA